MAAYVWGYRVALLVTDDRSHLAPPASSAGTSPARRRGAAARLAPVVTLLAPEPHAEARRAACAGHRAPRMRHAVIDPLRDFLSRPGALMILAFVALFKLGEAMAGIMTAPFYRRWVSRATRSLDRAVFAGRDAGRHHRSAAGWSRASASGRALLWTGSAQTLAMAMYVRARASAGSMPCFMRTVATEAFAQGMADAAFMTYLSGLCSMAFTATHYALLSSLAALAMHTIGGFSGVLAEALGWTRFYGCARLPRCPRCG